MNQVDSAMQPESSRRSIAGPRDRESFLDEQRRNRHATWRLSTVSASAAAIMGIPLALTITPLLYAVGLMAADIVSLWTPLPASFWHFANIIGQYGTAALVWLLQGNSADPQTLAVGAAVLLLPGALLSLGLWRGVNALFRRSGVGGALLALKAREPNPSDLTELRLADVVQEMAIAAGLPAPGIMLIDSPAANAAAIGTSPHDARIVVSRGLIERLSRDELEGVFAHLVASIGNGDLRIAFRVTSVFETCGLLVALINAPFGPHARRTLWRVVRYGFSPKKDDATGAAESDALAGLLTRGANMEFDDINTFFQSSSSKKSVLRSIRNFLLFPIFLTNATIRLSLWFFSFSTLGPSIALLWRKRVYLADACAVQLTRNPNGLADALRKLNSSYARIPGGEWASHLFLVNPAGSDRMSGTPASTPQQQVLARAWAASATAACAPRRSSDPSAVMQEIMTTGRAAMAGDQQAMARMLAFRQTAATAFGINEAEMPSLEDLSAAQYGDVQAMLRLQQFSKRVEGIQGERESSSAKSNPSSGFAGFHPSLKRRLKRLDRMGAHVELEATDRKVWPFIAFLAIVLGPFALVALCLLVVLIGILTMTSLACIALWMAVIHQVFVVFAHH
jgi:Zn-dependent protease with chaperone function